VLLRDVCFLAEIGVLKSSTLYFQLLCFLSLTMAAKADTKANAKFLPIIYQLSLSFGFLWFGEPELSFL
jgi:hypothetical protein